VVLFWGSFCIIPVYMGCTSCAFNKLISPIKKTMSGDVNGKRLKFLGALLDFVMMERVGLGKI
jgi:hypothetical protein